MSLRAVLKHVQVLEDAGLVRTVKEGRVRRCELEPAEHRRHRALDGATAAALGAPARPHRGDRPQRRRSNERRHDTPHRTDHRRAARSGVPRLDDEGSDGGVVPRRPDDAVARVIELDVRVGGGTAIEWGPQGEKPYVETGVYLEIDPPRQLKVTETLEAPESTPWADTTVTVVFEEEDGKTRLTLVHENFPSRERARQRGRRLARLHRSRRTDGCWHTRLICSAPWSAPGPRARSLAIALLGSAGWGWSAGESCRGNVRGNGRARDRRRHGRRRARPRAHRDSADPRRRHARDEGSPQTGAVLRTGSERVHARAAGTRPARPPRDRHRSRATSTAACSRTCTSTARATTTSCCGSATRAC